MPEPAQKPEIFQKQNAIAGDIEYNNARNKRRCPAI